MMALGERKRGRKRRSVGESSWSSDVGSIRGGSGRVATNLDGIFHYRNTRHRYTITQYIYRCFITLLYVNELFIFQTYSLYLHFVKGRTKKVCFYAS